MTQLLQTLKSRFGFDHFRPGQQQTIEQLLAGYSSLAIFPTGSGKSLCYQLTALQLPHLTLVVSPLLALMKDQLEFLQAKGIAAASIDSSLSADQSRDTMRAAREGRLKILMVSVERFKNERFRTFIEALPISMLVVDEAHCISEWGHNFRPDYLKLPQYCRQLNIPLVLLLTATATQNVKQEMAERFAILPEHISQTGFYRNNLHLSVQSVSTTDKLVRLQQIVNQQWQHFGANSSGIVYVTLQHSAEEVAAWLSRQGVLAKAYHAGFDSDKRRRIQDEFMAGEVSVVVATIAFGMGIDKANIRFVVHYDLPKSIENYSQEIGRAGRDGKPSHCITLANLDGVTTLENFVYGDTPEAANIDAALTSVAAQLEPSNPTLGRWSVQLLRLSNATNIRLLTLKTLLVQLELMAVIKPLYSYFADVRYKFLQPKEQVLAAFNGERQSFLQALFDCGEAKRVWITPDFERLYRGYGSDRSRALSALDYLAEQGFLVLESKAMTEVFEVDVKALKAPSLVAVLSQYFVDKEQKDIRRIASLLDFFQLDRCLSHSLARYFDDAKAPPSCGHCSVCEGQVARLSYSRRPPWPDEGQFQQALAQLQQAVSAYGERSADESQSPVQVSAALQARFLAGIQVPLFSQLKARKLAGFGLCEQQRYAEILKRLAGLA